MPSTFKTKKPAPNARSTPATGWRVRNPRAIKHTASAKSSQRLALGPGMTSARCSSHARCGVRVAALAAARDNSEVTASKLSRASRWVAATDRSVVPRASRSRAVLHGHSDGERNAARRLPSRKQPSRHSPS